MMIKEVHTYEELYEIVILLSRAYPLVISSDEESVDRISEKLNDQMKTHSDQHIYSVKDGDTLLGCMRYFDFNMQLFSKKIPVGGIGMVVVDLLHKKKGVAKTIVSDFLCHYKEKGAVMATLYPFRPDFYKKMGFGFGKSLNQFKIPPSAFPKGQGKTSIKHLTRGDVDEILVCYHRYRDQTNGLFEKFPDEITGVMDSGQRFLGFEKNGRLEGYFSYTLEKISDVNTMTQNMRIHQLVFENVEALMAFSEFF